MSEKFIPQQLSKEDEILGNNEEADSESVKNKINKKIERLDFDGAVKVIEEGGEKIQLNSFKLFPSFFSDFKRKSLFENGYLDEGDHFFEYAQNETIETDNYYVCVMDYAERFHDENGDSSRKHVEIVYRKKDGDKERHVSKEYWTSFTGRDGRTASNTPDHVDYGGPLKVKSIGDDKIEINMTNHRGVMVKDGVATVMDEEKIYATFSADLSMGGEIEEIKI